MRRLLPLLLLGLVAARPVKVVEWVDFFCPFCRKFAEEGLPAMRARYGEDMEYDLRQLPIESIHPGATIVAEGAECAREQGLLIPFHDALFQMPTLPSEGQMAAVVGGLGGDVAAFGACVRFGAMTDKVRADLAEARRLRITGTPHFVIDEVEISGWPGNEALWAVMDAAIAQDAPLTLSDLDPPLTGRIYTDPLCGPLCAGGMASWLERNFPTMEIVRIDAPADTVAIPYVPYIEVGTEIREAVRFPSLANLLMARGGSWVLRPDALRRVYLRERPEVSARPQRGPADGVPVLVFTSFTCPWCAKQNEVLREVEGSRPVRWQFMHFLRDPQRDVPLAIASECAYRKAGEEAFWALFDELFRARPATREALEETFARATGLEPERLSECATDSALMSRIAKDHATAERLGIAVTPATAVGPILLTGLVEAPALEEWLDRAEARLGGEA